MEPALFDRLDHVGPQHEVSQVLVRHHNPLVPGQSGDTANVIHAFDFLIDSADGLYFPFLIHRPGHGDVLLQRQTGQARHDGVQLGGGSAISVDTVVGLLEAEAGG